MSLKTILILIGIAVIGLALIYAPKAIRVNKMIHLYDKDKIAYNFINMDKIFRASTKDLIHIDKVVSNLVFIVEMNHLIYSNGFGCVN